MDWTQAEAVLETAAASVFDKTAIRILPRKDDVSVNQPRIADPSRAEFDAVATIESGPQALAAASRIAADPATRASPVTFEKVMSAYVVEWAYVPKREDRILVGGRTYDIKNVDRDGTDRAVFYLNSSR